MSNVIYRNGEFVWRELMTQDVAASVRFYAEVLGWKTETVTMPDGGEYTTAKAGATDVCGIMKPPAPMPNYWGSAVSVADVAAVAKRVTENGGQILAGPMDVLNMGTYLAFQDPQGAVVNAWNGTQGDGPASPPKVGEFCWEQLNTTAPADAVAFYTKVLGWTSKPFSGGGDMRVFEAGKAQVASVMTNPPGVPAHWLTYVVVDKLASTYDRVKQHGGKVMVERIEVPTVGTIGVIQDNLGAVLGVFENPSK